MGNIKKSKLICKDFIKAITAILLILITSFYAIKIYDTATNLNYKLSWFLMDLQQRRIVELKHNNLYEYGIEGILQDINDKFKLPDKLYISDSFQLDFDKEGTILSFESFLYGKDKNGKLKTFLISYDKNKSNDITIYLNGNVNPSYERYCKSN